MRKKDKGASKNTVGRQKEILGRKIAVRDEVAARIKNLSQKEIYEKSRVIKDRLFSMNEFKVAGRILFYYSVRTEVETRGAVEDAISMEKTVLLPRVSDGCLEVCSVGDCGSDLEESGWGIMEPRCSIPGEADAEKIDIVIVPGIAFDAKGNRIGRGKGFYDRYLKLVPKAVKIGLAFELQVVNDLPVEDHDVRVDYLVTEKRILKSNERR